MTYTLHIDVFKKYRVAIDDINVYLKSIHIKEVYMKKSIITDQVDMDLEKALPIIKREGYKYVELHNVFGKSIEEINDEEIEKVKKLLNQFDLRVTSIASTVYFLCPLYATDQVSLFNPEFFAIEGNVEKHLEYLKRACYIAKQLNADVIRVFPFRFPDNRKPPFGGKVDKENIIANLKLAVNIAQENDIVLALENCPYSHLPKGQMTYEVIQAISSPNLRLLWDPANSYRAYKENVPKEYLSKNLLEELDLIFPYIEHIHIKDYHFDPNQKKPFVHRALLEGDIDFKRILEILKEKGYSNAISLEPEVDFENTLKSMNVLSTIS